MFWTWFISRGEGAEDGGKFNFFKLLTNFSNSFLFDGSENAQNVIQPNGVTMDIFFLEIQKILPPPDPHGVLRLGNLPSDPCYPHRKRAPQIFLSFLWATETGKLLHGLDYLKKQVFPKVTAQQCVIILANRTDEVVGGTKNKEFYQIFKVFFQKKNYYYVSLIYFSLSSMLAVLCDIVNMLSKWFPDNFHIL